MQKNNSGITLLTEVYLLSVILLKYVHTWKDCSTPGGILWNFSGSL